MRSGVSPPESDICVRCQTRCEIQRPFSHPFFAIKADLAVTEGPPVLGSILASFLGLEQEIELKDGMCCANWPGIICENSRENGRSTEHIQHQQLILAEETVNRLISPQREEESVQHSGRNKFCICSPTNHAGSFRCRLHRSSYKWGRKRSSSA